MITIDVLGHNINGIKIHVDKNMCVTVSDNGGNPLQMGQDYNIIINPLQEGRNEVVVNLPSGITISTNKE